MMLTFLSHAPTLRWPGRSRLAIAVVLGASLMSVLTMGSVEAESLHTSVLDRAAKVWSAKSEPVSGAALSCTNNGGKSAEWVDGDRTWSCVYYFGTVYGAKVLESPDLSSAQINTMRTETSWFACKTPDNGFARTLGDDGNRWGYINTSYMSGDITKLPVC